MSRQINLNPVQPVKSSFLNTRDIDRAKVKRIALVGFILLLIVPNIFIVVAWQFPNSSVAKSVRLLLFDATLINSNEGQKVIKTGQELIDKLRLAMADDKDKEYARQGWHPIQQGNPFLDGMIYGGKGFFSSPGPMLVSDFTSDCLSNADEAKHNNMLFCGSVLKVPFEVAQEVCKIRHGGLVANGYETLNTIFKSSRIARTNEILWSRQVYNTHFFTADEYFVVNPDRPGEALYSSENNNHAFYCINQTEMTNGQKAK